MFKKLLCVVLAQIILCCMSFSLVSASDVVYLRGDSDLSGDISINDSSRIQKHCVKMITLNDTELFVSDIDGDDEVNIFDATQIQKHLAKMSYRYNIGGEITMGTEKLNKNVSIYFTNNKGWKSVNVYAYNSDATAENKTWPGEEMTFLTTNDYGEEVYSLTIDTSLYDRIIFNNGNGGEQTINIPVSCTSSGFFISGGSSTAYQVGVYPYGRTSEGTVNSFKLEYSEGYEKEITVYLPEGYSVPGNRTRYDVVYLIDGQNMFSDDAPFGGGWCADENADSMMALGGRDVILVGIDNANSKRDSELTPDLGGVIPEYNEGGFANPTGEEFSDFVVNKVMPYINNYYQVATGRSHTAIVGSSSGGLESLYIGLEHSDKFGYVGSLSPAFLLFTETQWNTYLGSLNLSQAESLPRIYIATGGGDSLEQEIYPAARDMKTWLTNNGYSADLVEFEYDDTHQHNEAYWRVFMPRMFAFLYDL